MCDSTTQLPLPCMGGQGKRQYTQVCTLDPSWSVLPSPLIPAQGTHTYNVILFVVVGNVLPQSPDDDHAENP